MWECLKCGCKAIARDLGFCPHCLLPREDGEMPKATTGGPSNAKAEPGEPGYIAPDAEETAVADAPPAVAADGHRAPAGPASEPEKTAEAKARKGPKAKGG